MSEMEEHTREEELANLEVYVVAMDDVIKDYPEVRAVIDASERPVDCVDRTLLLVKYLLTVYMLCKLEDPSTDYFSEQVYRLNQARDALVRAKDARDIHETT